MKENEGFLAEKAEGCREDKMKTKWKKVLVLALVAAMMVPGNFESAATMEITTVPLQTASQMPEAAISASPSAVATASALPQQTHFYGLGYRDVPTGGGLQLIETIEISAPKQYQKGDKIKAGKLIYKVTTINKNGNGKVKVVKACKKNYKKIKIPAKIKKGQQTFQVTGIAKKAFSGCKKLSKMYLQSKKMKRYVKSKRKTIALPKKCKIYLKKQGV